MSVYVSPALRRQIRQQFANCCAYCHTAERLTVATFEIEHIQPISGGGQTELANLCLACPSCNRHKATRLTAVDPLTNHSVQLFHPQQELGHDHFSWDTNGIELIGLTATGRATIHALKMNRPQVTRVRQMWAKMGEHPPKR